MRDVHWAGCDKIGVHRLIERNIRTIRMKSLAKRDIGNPISILNVNVCLSNNPWY